MLLIGLYHNILSVASYRSQENRGFVSVTVQYMMCANNCIHHGLQVVFVYLHIALSQNHQYTVLSGILCYLIIIVKSVTGEFSSQRPVTRSFDVFFDLCLNKPLSK